MKLQLAKAARDLKSTVVLAHHLSKASGNVDSGLELTAGVANSHSCINRLVGSVLKCVKPKLHISRNRIKFNPPDKFKGRNWETVHTFSIARQGKFTTCPTDRYCIFATRNPSF